MERLARWALAPALQVWVASRSDEVDRLPRPLDAPEWHSPGADADRVLIFGGGPAVGWGVLSHELALTGSLGRMLSQRTRRGADVYAHPVPRLKIASALPELRKVEIEHCDAVVITLGVNDAGALTPTTSWERGLSALLQTIDDRTSPQARIYVAGVHPIRSILNCDNILGSIVEAHARRLNVISASVCEEFPTATYIPLTAPVPKCTLRFRDATSYRHWAQELAAVMAPNLDIQRVGAPAHVLAH